jgi:hypothetical protein
MLLTDGVVFMPTAATRQFLTPCATGMVRIFVPFSSISAQPSHATGPPGVGQTDRG